MNLFIENASRFCHANGTWDKYANYDQCDQIDLTYGIETLPHLEYITHIWTAGYTLSLVSLILGIAIFIHFKWVFKWMFLLLLFIFFNFLHSKRMENRFSCAFLCARGENICWLFTLILFNLSDTEPSYYNLL